MKTIAVILTTIFKKRDNLKDLLNDLSAQAELISEVSITFQRSPDNHFDAREIGKYLEEYPKLQVLYEIVDELNTSSGRNRAIAKVKADWIACVDDDCRIPQGAIDKVIRAIEANAEIDAFTFRSKRPNKKFRKNKFKHTRISIKSVSLIEIVFNRRVLSFLGSKPFDENFGLGCRWINGEEQIFLSDIINNGGKVVYIPEEIIEHEELSSGYLFNPLALKSRGAMFRRMFGFWGILLSILFVFKKRFDGRLDFSLLKGLKLITSGFNEFKGH